MNSHGLWDRMAAIAQMLLELSSHSPLIAVLLLLTSMVKKCFAQSKSNDQQGLKCILRRINLYCHRRFEAIIRISIDSYEATEEQVTVGSISNEKGTITSLAPRNRGDVRRFWGK
jgi:hypothetical protein